MTATLYFKAHEAHELERVALGDNAFAQSVIESHFPVFDLIFEVQVADQPVASGGNFRKSQIMSCDDANRALLQQGFQ